MVLKFIINKWYLFTTTENEINVVREYFTNNYLDLSLDI